MPKRIDLTGQRFGRLKVMKFCGTDHRKHAVWMCKCDCGNIDPVRSYDLRAGKITSCGCYHNECAKFNHTKHGKSGTKLYYVWKSMKQRCENVNSRDYRIYGENGVCVCDDWRSCYETFYDWAMRSGYEEGLTLDRIDSNGNYCPENCRWATPKVQSNNTCRNRLITYKGETHTMSEWASITGINYSTLRARLNMYKWSVERALTTGGKIRKCN